MSFLSIPVRMYSLYLMWTGFVVCICTQRKVTKFYSPFYALCYASCVVVSSSHTHLKTSSQVCFTYTNLVIADCITKVLIYVTVKVHISNPALPQVFDLKNRRWLVWIRVTTLLHLYHLPILIFHVLHISICAHIARQPRVQRPYFADWILALAVELFSWICV